MADILPGMAGVADTGRYEQYWQAWPLLAYMAEYCLVWLLMNGVADTGCHDQYWLDGLYWLV